MSSSVRSSKDFDAVRFQIKRDTDLTDYPSSLLPKLPSNSASEDLYLNSVAMVRMPIKSFRACSGIAVNS